MRGASSARALPPGVTRTDTSAIEPRYLAALEAGRAAWWNSANFDTWKNLYVSEYARGYDVMATLCACVPGFDVTGARVLDVGCGDAGVPIAFAEGGAACAGVEVDEASLERGRLRATEHGVELDLRPGAAESLPWDDASFDLVILDNVLEHVRDRERSLAEIRRVLRPGGLLYLVTPKPLSLYSIWNDPHYDLAGLVLLPRPAQVWYFERVRGAGAGAYDVGVIPTRRALRRLLAQGGFSVVVQPRDLWIRYLRGRIARPGEVQAGARRRLAAWLAGRDWPFEHPVLRWMWDVALGSNIVIARSRP